VGRAFHFMILEMRRPLPDHDSVSSSRETDIYRQGFFVVTSIHHAPRNLAPAWMIGLLTHACDTSVSCGALGLNPAGAACGAVDDDGI
jgi:hypothetical protein